MYKNYQFYLAQLYRISDLIALNITYLFFLFLIFKDQGLFISYAIIVFLFINVLWLLISAYFRLYNLNYPKSKNRYVFSVGLSIFLSFSISLFAVNLFYYAVSEPPIIKLIGYYLSFGALLTIFRWITFVGYKYHLKRKKKRHTIVLVGSGIRQNELYAELKKGLNDDFQEVIRFKKAENLHKKLNELQKTKEISQLYIPLSKYSSQEVNAINKFCDNNFIRMRLVFDITSLNTRRINVKQYEATTIINFAVSPLDDPYNALVKRSFDIVFSLAFFLLFFWIFPLIAIAVKLSSKGPVFFKQMRSGINNRQFVCYKFRSMRENEEADYKQATQDDPRITKVGAFLRRSSLDELPQFFNVLIGNMSVVGPRPHMIKHTAEYQKATGNFMERHAIKPGITGLAQTRGYRGEIQNFSLLKNRLRMDRFYVNNWTLYFDIRIIMSTISGIFKIIYNKKQ